MQQKPDNHKFHFVSNTILEPVVHLSRSSLLEYIGDDLNNTHSVDAETPLAFCEIQPKWEQCSVTELWASLWSCMRTCELAPADPSEQPIRCDKHQNLWILVSGEEHEKASFLAYFSVCRLLGNQSHHKLCPRKHAFLCKYVYFSSIILWKHPENFMSSLSLYSVSKMVFASAWLNLRWLCSSL